jgi:hypothetical protein
MKGLFHVFLTRYQIKKLTGGGCDGAHLFVEQVIEPVENSRQN